ncbi:ribosome recycling factor [Ignatzschineria ureiclastica]|uniref:Ribosome-recycling factor n=1 Tax=Ignatzschineria ureiclastica TaxID=472582 RepID=A0A2U2AGR1_9GAMM|nr:ribosome recycling factor [Ignatzschineria ureiclastica]PWD81854.1 ribosome recycling factor [Ignatzschineria ureiclastica]GGZ90963.1 ribosome-recycling factor [Ignatzschineria ureiclastica]
MTQNIIKDAKNRMEKSVEALGVALGKIRTGRAHVSILDHIEVEYYGSMVPLSQVANLTVQDSRTLGISPWEKTMVGPIEKAIINSDLGLNPATTGTLIRVPLPPLTEERRKELVKVVGGEAEQAKVAVRNIRRDANNQIAAMEKAGEISEDIQRRAEEEIQKLTDTTTKKIEEVLAQKEEELMEI